MTPNDFTAKEFASAFQRFLEWINEEGRGDGAAFAGMLREHFGPDPATFPVTAERMAGYDLPNLQLALDAYLDRSDVEHRLIGFAGPIEHFDLSLSGLVHDVEFGLAAGPVRRNVVPLDEGRRVTCVTTGLFLLSRGDVRLAVLLSQGRRGFDESGLRIDVMAPDPAEGERFLSELRDLMHARNVYRGKVLELGGGEEMGGDVSVGFPSVPQVSRDDIVLPEGTLELVELHTVEFSRHTEALRAGGRHLRRGLLLHGHPGTGKTLTASYLISCLEGRATVILRGAGLGLISPACALARDLQPALLILEDVDLVAHERTSMFGTTSLLFELLNEMDGLGEDADVIFLMTTNRADLLEPALATRPGRVDQAVELPLPDAPGRSRLLELFCRGLDMSLADPDAIVAATDGTSPAFIRELVRKAALHAALAGNERVSDEHFAEALQVLERGGSVTRAVLGGEPGDSSSRLHDGGDWSDDEGWDEG